MAYLSAVAYEGAGGSHDVRENEPRDAVSALGEIDGTRVDVHPVFLVLVGVVEGGGRLGGRLEREREGGRVGGRVRCEFGGRIEKLET